MNNNCNTLGLPYLSSVEEWPKCKKCKKGLCFYFQLNFDTMPDKYKQKYLFNNNIYKGCILQLFYCTDDMCGMFTMLLS